jgi:hypothetical protein
MKHGIKSTAPALVAGFMVLLSIQDLLTQNDVDIGPLPAIANAAIPS